MEELSKEDVIDITKAREEINKGNFYTEEESKNVLELNK